MAAFQRRAESAPPPSTSTCTTPSRPAARRFVEIDTAPGPAATVATFAPAALHASTAAAGARSVVITSVGASEVEERAVGGDATAPVESTCNGATSGAGLPRAR